MQIVALTLAAALSSPLTQDADLGMVDRVEVVINDEILTYQQVMGVAVRSIPEGTQLQMPEFTALRNRIGSGLIRERLELQGGLNMGFKPEEVERSIKNLIERRIDDAGGVIQLADQLSQNSLSLNDEKKKLRRVIYRDKWKRAITGQGAGVFGRIYRDRYVRPGMLQLYYEQIKDGRLDAEAIGGTSALYFLQEINLGVSPVNDTDAELVRQQAEELRDQLKEGADFTEIIRAQPKPPEKDGMLPPYTWLAFARNGFPKIAAFARSAAVGDFSEPIEIVRDGKVVGWRIMKLIKAEKPVLPIFNLPRTQAALRKVIQNEMDNHRLDVGVRALRDGAYVWPDEEDQNT